MLNRPVNLLAQQRGAYLFGVGLGERIAGHVQAGVLIILFLYLLGLFSPKPCHRQWRQSNQEEWKDNIDLQISCPLQHVFFAHVNITIDNGSAIRIMNFLCV